MIPGKREQLVGLVKLARHKRDSETMDNQVSMISASLVIKRMCINKTHRSKTVHLLVEINNYVLEGLVDTGASMSIMVAAIVS